MLTILKTFDDGLRELELADIEPGAWMNLIDPSVEELNAVKEITAAPDDFIHAALDPEEASRIELEDDHILVLINVPKDHDDRIQEYDTLPVGIIITPDHIVTICREENSVLANFTPAYQRHFSTFKRTRFLFQILYRSAALFLRDLRQINRMSDNVEQDLRKSMKNKELFQLLDLQKGLTYFSMSLRSNRVVIERLMRLFSNIHVNHLVKLREEDEDLLDDVRVEYDQAIEMTHVQTVVLAGMMDAFASVISNNLNIVMKFLASVTIVMSIPTMIASFFGMNVALPWGSDPNGFLIIIVISLITSAILTYFLWKREFF